MKPAWYLHSKGRSSSSEYGEKKMLQRQISAMKFLLVDHNKAIDVQVLNTSQGGVWELLVISESQLHEAACMGSLQACTRFWRAFRARCLRRALPVRRGTLCWTAPRAWASSSWSTAWPGSCAALPARASPTASCSSSECLPPSAQ